MATILKALITGVMPPMDPADEREHEALFKMLDEKGQLFEIQQQQRAYDQRKASGLDNAQKNSAVLSSIGVAIVAVIALVNALIRINT